MKFIPRPAPATTRKSLALLAVCAVAAVLSPHALALKMPCKVSKVQTFDNQFKCDNGTCTGYYKINAQMYTCRSTLEPTCVESPKADFTITYSAGEQCSKDADCGQGMNTQTSNTTTNSCN